MQHGMGIPSMSIMLHEITKLLAYAGATDVVYIRIGSSGGLGVPPGSIVITDEALDGELNAYHTLKINGKSVQRPAVLDRKLADEIYSLAEPGINVVIGKTICAEDFYEGQARLDGAICEHTHDEKLEFLKRAHDMGVRNVEMESLVFAAFTTKLNIPGVVICATYLNRLDGDQIDTPADVLKEYSDRPQRLAVRFMKHRLGLPL
eukprot:Opistho-2@13848